MRKNFVFSVMLAWLGITASSANAAIQLKNPRVTCGVGIQELEVVWDNADDASGFNDRDQVAAMLNQAYYLIATKCGSGSLMSYNVVIKDMRGNTGFTATMYLYDKNRQWNYQTRMPQLIELSKQQSKNEEVARKALEARQAVARQDCGQQAAISGGPWFSSTYKVAVNDEIGKYIQSGRMFCIKSVEYISAAPNPLGGNAARIKVTGYDRSLRLVYFVEDIAY